MNRKSAILCVFLAVLCSPACLQQQTGHTLYLSQDGAVTWTTMERDIHSDARDPAERAREEQDFLNQLTAGTHPMLTGLRSLDPSSSRVRFVRRERPYLVLTEARFDRADRMLQKLFDELRIPGAASLTRTADQTTLSIAFEVPGQESASADESPIAPLADFDEPYRFVLTAGRFVSAAGFTLDSDGAVAALDEEWMTERCKPGAMVTLSLTWIASAPSAERPIFAPAETAGATAGRRAPNY
jgi:hypothetical protein